VEMEEDLLFLVMMEITIMEMAALLIVVYKSVGVVQEDLPIQEMYVLKQSQEY
jgi:hypothetical protein